MPVVCTGKSMAPSDEGAGFCVAKDWGREYSSSCFSPDLFAYGESTSLIRGRQAAAAGLCKAKAFWNHRHCRWFSYTSKNLGRTLLRGSAQHIYDNKCEITCQANVKYNIRFYHIHKYRPCFLWNTPSCKMKDPVVHYRHEEGNQNQPRKKKRWYQCTGKNPKHRMPRRIFRFT